MTRLLEAAALYFTPALPFQTVNEQILHWEFIRNSMQPPEGRFAKLVYNIVMRKIERELEALYLLRSNGVVFHGIIKDVPDGSQVEFDWVRDLIVITKPDEEES